MLGVQRRATGRVRRNGRGLTDLVGKREPGTQLPRLTRDLRRVLSTRHSAFQLGDRLLQSIPLGALRQGNDQALQRSQVIDLLLVLDGVHDLAVCHGRRVIGPQVIQQMQRLGCTLDRVGQRNAAAQRQERQQ